jgi:signal transduction histidine kinase
VGRTLGPWWAVALFFIGEHLVEHNLHRNPEIRWWGPIVSQLVMATLWAAASPRVLRAAEVCADERRWWLRVARPAAGGLALALLLSGVRTLLHEYEHTPASRPCMLGLLSVVKYLHVDALLFAAVFALGLARRHAAERAAHRAHAAEVEAQLTRARLQVLQGQLNPHFLFNALNTVSALVDRDPRGTRVVVARLSELLRRGLDAAQRPETELAEEVHFLRAYLEIMALRFGDRLTVSIDLAPELERARVPTFILQPLVENAIEHGIARLRGPGQLAIRAERVGEQLRLEVRDNGPGPAAASPAGIGLGNIAARLEQLYGGAAALRLAADRERGAVATVALPYRLFDDDGDGDPEGAR